MFRNAIDFVIVHAAIIVPAALVLALIWSRNVRAAASLLLRVVARPLLLVAVLALVYDGTQTLAGGRGFVVTPLFEHWQSLAPHSLENLKGVVARKVHPQLWDAGVLRLLKLPAWLVVGALGLLLAWIGRKRHRVDVFVN